MALSGRGKTRGKVIVVDTVDAEVELKQRQDANDIVGGLDDMVGLGRDLARRFERSTLPPELNEILAAVAILTRCEARVSEYQVQAMEAAS